MGDGNGVELEKLTKVFLKIKARRSELSVQFKEQDDNLKIQQDTIKKALLDHCKEHNVESVRTSEGLFYRTVRTRFWTSDWQSMYKFITEHDVPELLEKRLNQSNVKQFLEENPEVLPMGLNVDSEYLISVRKK
jgi:Zn/Cd-binding protein ZinT